MASYRQYIVSFRVEGRYPFPIDMLRYDRCWPASSDDAARIDYSRLPGNREVYIIKLYMAADHAGAVPTAARWSSFGWTVLAEHTEPA
jgi:hypothetical protein